MPVAHSTAKAATHAVAAAATPAGKSCYELRTVMPEGEHNTPCYPETQRRGPEWMAAPFYHWDRDQ